VIRSRAKFTWYGGAALIAALLLAGGPARPAAAHTVTRSDSPVQTQATIPAVRIHLADDVLRRADRTWFAQAQPHYLALFYTVLETAPVAPSLQPARSEFVSLHARAPPTHR
jgi:hypothetical protein